jgi:hypothetical protein
MRKVRVARTIADLDGSDAIRSQHLADPSVFACSTAAHSPLLRNHNDVGACAPAGSHDFRDLRGYWRRTNATFEQIAERMRALKGVIEAVEK